MHKPLLAIGLWAAALPLAWAADTFSQRLTPTEYNAAGLAKLSPEELVQLNALFKKYGAFTIEAPPTVVPVAVTPPPAPPVAVAPAPVAPPAAKADTAAADTQQLAAKLAAAEARARQAEQEAAAAREVARVAKAEQKAAEPSLLSKAKKILVPAGTKVEIAAIEGQIDGVFNGWTSQTAWKLKDGTVWRVENNVLPYTAKRLQDPKVRIVPATLAGYWLEFPELDLRVRVRQLN